MKLGCRLGFHKWVRVEVDDPTVEASSDEWETRCRFCGKERRFVLSRFGGRTGM